MRLFGSHIDSDIKEIINEIHKIKSYGGNLIQCFVNIKYNKKDYQEIKNELEKNNMKIVIHASYTINIAQNWTEHSWWLKQFIHEIELAEYLGAFGIVLHLGKQLKLSTQEALNNMFTSMIYVYEQVKNTNIKILFETSTGQGSEMCYDLENFSYFFNKFIKINKINNDKFRICVDTCHIFQAGYDITNKKNIKLYFENFERLIGLRYIGLIHLNDSKNSIGSKLDRHESLGYGHIGKEALSYISLFFLKINTPIILETPDQNKFKDEIKNYFINV
jgi:deoxyribonuclease-4